MVWFELGNIKKLLLLIPFDNNVGNTLNEMCAFNRVCLSLTTVNVDEYYYYYQKMFQSNPSSCKIESFFVYNCHSRHIPVHRKPLLRPQEPLTRARTWRTPRAQATKPSPKPNTSDTPGYTQRPKLTHDSHPLWWWFHLVPKEVS